MRLVTIPLAGQMYSRKTQSGLDQIFTNVIFDEVIDSVSQSKSIWINKRGGLTQLYATVGTVSGVGIWASPSYTQKDAQTYKTTYAFDNGNVYVDNTLVGSLGTNAIALHFSETVINSEIVVLITSLTTAGANEGWFVPFDAVTGLTFTGDTHTNTTIDNVSSLTGLYVGQLITGTGIQANTRIATITSPSTITTTIATTATASITVTRSALAKIISANFPSDMTGALIPLNGYIFVMTVRGRIYNSGLNTAVTWAADSYVPADSKTDIGIGCVSYKGLLLGFGATTLDVFRITGNQSGSVLTREMGIQVDEGAAFAEQASPFGRKKAAIIQAHDTVFWVSNSLNIYKLDGFSPVNISKSLSLYINGIPASVDAITYSGKRIVIFTGAGSGGGDCVWYQPDENLWSDQNFISGSRFFFSEAFGVVYVIGYTDGKVYTLSRYDSSNFRDDTNSYSGIVQIEPKYLNDGMGFLINRIDLIATTQSSGTATVNLYTGDNNLGSINAAITIDMTAKQKRGHRCGLYRSCVQPYVSHSADTAFRAQALKMLIEPCPR